MTIILVLTVGAVLGLWIVWAMCMVAKRADEQAERQARTAAIQAMRPGVAIDDLLILAGSEGDNLPRVDIRAEVAEQLGCE